MGKKEDCSGPDWLQKNPNKKTICLEFLRWKNNIGEAIWKLIDFLNRIFFYQTVKSYVLPREP